MSEEPSNDDGDEQRSARNRIGEEKDRAVAGFDQRVVDILSWVLDTETSARIFVFLRQEPWSTSEEVADGTGLYPSTVREALAELSHEDIVERRKRQSEGAGNNPYEYTAIAPSELVTGIVGRVQSELNTIVNLDSHLGRSDRANSEPVHIEVENGATSEATDDESSENGEPGVGDERGVDNESGGDVEFDTDDSAEDDA